jgi:hypothetical protein
MRIINRWKALLFITLSVFIFGACNDPGDVGMELLPTSDLVRVGSKVDKELIRAYTFIDDSVRSDEASTSLLGSFHDPVFGNTTIDLAVQLRLTSFPNFGSNPVADSIKFFFYYYTVYGDTSTVQKLRFYELTEPIDPDVNYYGTYDLARHASSLPLAEYSFKPKVQLDTVFKDTVYQLVGVKLDKSLAQKLISADSLDMVNNESFLRYFKGLYIQPEKVSQGGAIVSLDMIPTSTFQGSALVLYYHNKVPNPTKADTTSRAYFITSFSARVNSFKHDYTQTAFYQNLNKETAVDSLIYVQSTGGLKSKIIIPGLENWRDSTNIAINKAELIFQVDTTASDFRKYPLPTQLLLTYANNNGVELLPRDYFFYGPYYGGYLQSDFTYRFNITQHLQTIIKGTNNNNGFYLTPYYKNNEMRRAVIKGSTSAQGIRFVVTYSKLLQ